MHSSNFIKGHFLKPCLWINGQPRGGIQKRLERSGFLQRIACPYVECEYAVEWKITLSALEDAAIRHYTRVAKSAGKRSQFNLPLFPHDVPNIRYGSVLCSKSADVLCYHAGSLTSITRIRLFVS